MLPRIARCSLCTVRRLGSESTALLRFARWSSTKPPIFQLTKPNVFPYDTSPRADTSTVLRDLEWTLTDSDCWAILSPSSSSLTKSHLISLLRSQIRVYPASAASHPILETLPPIQQSDEEGGPKRAEVDDVVQLVKFKTALSRTGEFEDFTARYFHIRDEDRLTVREHLEASLSAPVEAGGMDVILETARLLQIDEFLELPLVTLSNGQTRRARICRALLARPELLILEEPFTGLDTSSRALLTSLLASLHSARSPRILLLLRPQDPLPDFVTHVGLIPPLSSSDEPRVHLGPRDQILASDQARQLLAAGELERQALECRAGRRRAAARQQREGKQGEVLVQMKGVNVVYGSADEGGKERSVLQNIDWTIREGERWVLRGQNGSGKSTLLSVLLGDHPRSYQEDVTLFGKERYRQATATIQEHIGHISPEINNAFPRKHGPGALTARNAIQTGHSSIYCYRRPLPTEEALLEDLLARFDYPPLLAELDKPFAALSPAFQALVLLLRALVKRPKLLVLDEPFSGMDSEMLNAVRRFLDEDEWLREKRTAMVVISHFEEEVPDSVCRVLALEAGRVVERD